MGRRLDSKRLFWFWGQPYMTIWDLYFHVMLQLPQRRNGWTQPKCLCFCWQSGLHMCLEKAQLGRRWQIGTILWWSSFFQHSVQRMVNTETKKENIFILYLPRKDPSWTKNLFSSGRKANKHKQQETEKQLIMKIDKMKETRNMQHNWISKCHTCSGWQVWGSSFNAKDRCWSFHHATTKRFTRLNNTNEEGISWRKQRHP